jgi:hypothetical protein
MAAPFRAPRTPFNDAITRRRAVAFTQLGLEDVKTVKNRFNVTVNDVVMALCSDALRRFLLDRDQLPDSSLVATPAGSWCRTSGVWPTSSSPRARNFSRSPSNKRRVSDYELVGGRAGSIRSISLMTDGG